MTEEIKKVYTYNRGVFEVEDLIGLRADGQDFEILVHWKGFELSDSTWEKIDELYQDIPTRVIEYLSNEKEENPLAEHLYEAYGQVTAEANVVILGFPGQDENNNAGILNKEREWSEAEMEVLEDCVRAYGMGSWTEILLGNHLPGRPRDEIIQRVRDAVNSQYIGHLRGLHLSFEIMRKFNTEERAREHKWDKTSTYQLPMDPSLRGSTR